MLDQLREEIAEWPLPTMHASLFGSAAGAVAGHLVTPRERSGDRGLAAARTAVAQEYYLLAELVAADDRPFAHNAAAVNAVLAAVAASDAICCLRFGRYHAGEDHRSAATLLGRVRPDGPELAKHLAKVLAIKDQVHYSGDPLPESRMRSVLRSTARLVDVAEKTMAETRRG